MNNYHLFLIRSDQVTQILGHLAAGIVTLVLIFGLTSPQPAPAPSAPAVHLSTTTIPAGTEMLAASK